MVAVFVRFRFEDGIDRDAVTRIAEEAQGRFAGMPGLRSKAFTVDEDAREATNVYLWESEEAARAFFTDDLVERVTGLYGVRPSVRYADVAALVDNAHPA
jgi:heme-degrading monooxygenase HmoA